MHCTATSMHCTGVLPYRRTLAVAALEGFRKKYEGQYKVYTPTERLQYQDYPGILMYSKVCAGIPFSLVFFLHFM